MADDARILSDVSIQGKTRNCKFCGKEFKPRNYRVEHCSRKCGARTALALQRQNTIDKRVERLCRNCGTKFIHGRSDKECCTEACGSAFRYKETNRKVAEARASRRHGRFCVQCGVEFVAKRSDAIHCSRKCVANTHLAKFRNNTVEKRRAKGLVNCQNCGTPFPVKHLSQKFCTDACAKNHSYKLIYAEIVKVREKERKAVPDRDCQQCGKSFSPTHRDVARQKFCSAVCNMRHHSGELHARRMEIITAPSSDKIDWMVVGDRYGWKCGMCSCEVLKEHRGKRRLTTPEIDHVIPLSKGGTHTYANIQLLCFPCNRSKLARIIPGLTSLFADQ